jgi:RNA polymerase sigma-70 factor (ECF subfamily)
MVVSRVMQSDPAVRAAFEEGRQAWPGVKLSLDRFARRVEEAEINPADLAARKADLFLAYACAEGDGRAIALFESELLSQVQIYVSRFKLTSHSLDEVRQRIRVKLLVGERPGIARYRGYGPLGAWLRVTAVRVALDVVGTTDEPWQSVDMNLLDLGLGLDDTPELAAAKNLYRARLCTALEEGLRLLSARDRTLLRFYAVDGLNIDEIGAIYRVHRATVARWLIAVRVRILDHARHRLGLRRAASSSEMRSLISLLRAEISLSAERILATDDVT